jgi:adenosylmethionine-8-amino-7-oxononanoate aminotransferase
MAAVELVSDRATKEMLTPPSSYIQALVGTARQEGAMIRVQGNRLILSPPLVFTHAHVDETLRILNIAFSAAENI